MIMKLLTPIALINLASLTISSLSQAEPVRLLDCAPQFRSKAVLQQGVEVPVWGRAVEGSEITVTFAGQSHTTKADAEGNWKVVLKALKADSLDDLSTAPEGRDLKMSDGKDTITYTNILIGEVWLASGQSNMAGKVRNNVPDPKDNLTKVSMPAIRQYRADTGWYSASGEEVREFSKVGLTFARKLQKELKVPVGILNATRGGSAIETWTRPEDQPQEGEQTKNGKKKRPYGTLYTSTLQPLIGTAIKGALWYQGEANAGEGFTYYDKLETLIKGWREEWGQGDFPFHVVQLAGIGESDPANPTMGDGRAAIRAAQMRAMQQIPNVGLATAVEIGGPKEHPPNKTDIGKRLAHWALHHQYDRKIQASGPIYAGYQKRCSTFAIRFENAKKLFFAEKDGSGAPVVSPGNTQLPWISIRDPEGVWHWALAWIEGNELLVHHPDIRNPKAVRYAWTNNPTGPYLYNEAGLPAFPFTTEKWEDISKKIE